MYASVSYRQRDDERFYFLLPCERRSVVSNSLRPHGLYSPWNSPGQNTGVGSFSLPVCCFRIPGYSARRSNRETLHRKQRQTQQCSVLPFYDITFQPPLQKVKVKVTQSCLTLCDPMHYRLRGILQARILEWVVFPFSRLSSGMSSSQTYNFSPKERKGDYVAVSTYLGYLVNWLQKVVRYIKVWMDANLFFFIVQR